jgi:hypothetical protein
MGEIVLVTVLVGTVSAATHMLYRHPIRWNSDSSGGSDSLANNTR